MINFMIVAFAVFLSGMLLEVHTLYYIAYFFLLFYLFLRYYHRNIEENLEINHQVIDDHIFMNEFSRCKVEFINKGSWPVLWITAQEYIPKKLSSDNISGVIHLKGKEKKEWNFELKGRRRGYYRLGPLEWETGDNLGYKNQQGYLENSNPLIVYPRIVSLEELGLPSRLPFGEISWPQPIYKDPNQVAGVREYQSGDSLKRIHWKATAKTGSLQVRKYDSTVSLETVIFLNLNLEDYGMKRLEPMTELAVITAASLANYLTEIKQPFGLVTNGLDPLFEDEKNINVPVGKGHHHLQKTLELLARIEVAKGRIFSDLLNQEPDLSWGATLLIITKVDTDEIMDRILSLRQRGFSIKLLVLERVRHRQYLHLPFTAPVVIYKLQGVKDLHGL